MLTAIHNAVGKMQSALIGKFDSFGDCVWERMPFGPHHDFPRFALLDQPHKMCPLAQVGQLCPCPRRFRVGTGGNVRKAIVHSARIVLQPVSIDLNRAIRTLRRNEQVMLQNLVPNLRDLAANLRQNIDE